MSENKPHLAKWADDVDGCVCGCQWCSPDELCTGPEYEISCTKDEEHQGDKGPWITCAAGAKAWETHIQESERARGHWSVRRVDAVEVA